MTPRLLAACLAALLLPGAALAAADLPAYDPVRTCTDTARRSGARSDSASPACIESETSARNRSAELWPQLSAGARQRCARLSERRESFLVLSGCVEREASIGR